MRRNNLIFNMSLIAVFSALSFVVTAFLAVPIASGAGYLNFQDCIIFALASLIHPLVGGIVGGLTGMLADIYAGYASFADTGTPDWTQPGPDRHGAPFGRGNLRWP